MGGGLESRCVGRVYGADGAVHGTIRSVNAAKILIGNEGDKIAYRKVFSPLSYPVKRHI